MGNGISPEDKYKSYNVRMIVQQKILKAHIDKGMKDGQRMRLYG